MNPICVQKYIKRKVRFEIRYKLSDLYAMYLEKSDAYELIHRKKVKPIKMDTLRKSIGQWDWIEARGEPKARYYVRIDDRPKTEFSDLYESVMHKFRTMAKKRVSLWPR